MKRRCRNCRFCVAATLPNDDGEAVNVHYCHGGPPQYHGNGVAFPQVAVDKDSFWCAMHQYSWRKLLASA